MNIKHAFKQCARALGNDDWCEQLDRHFVALKRRGPRLVVTFDNMTSRDAHGPRNPWGWNIVESLGHSHLGVCMSRRNDWFRHPDLFDLFDRLRDQGFFEQFEDVVFYGSSMGGCGALSFAQAAPGAHLFRKPRCAPTWLLSSSAFSMAVNAVTIKTVAMWTARWGRARRAVLRCFTILITRRTGRRLNGCLRTISSFSERPSSDTRCHACFT